MLVQQSTLSILLDRFEGQTNLSVLQIQKSINWTNPQSIRNAISLDKFPIPTYKMGRFRYADIRDVAAYLDDLRRGPAKLGRPTKAERKAAEAAGVTVQQLRKGGAQ